MTKDTEEFEQFTEPVACREYTLPRDEKSSDPKGWIRGNTPSGPVFEGTTSCKNCYLIVKGYGLILNQELNPVWRTQWQEDCVLFFVMDNYLEKKMERSNSGD